LYLPVNTIFRLSDDTYSFSSVLHFTKFVAQKIETEQLASISATRHIVIVLPDHFGTWIDQNEKWGCVRLQTTALISMWLSAIESEKIAQAFPNIESLELIFSAHYEIPSEYITKSGNVHFANKPHKLATTLPLRELVKVLYPRMDAARKCLFLPAVLSIKRALLTIRVAEKRFNLADLQADSLLCKDVATLEDMMLSDSYSEEALDEMKSKDGVNDGGDWGHLPRTSP